MDSAYSFPARHSIRFLMELVFVQENNYQGHHYMKISAESHMFLLTFAERLGSGLTIDAKNGLKLPRSSKTVPTRPYLIHRAKSLHQNRFLA